MIAHPSSRRTSFQHPQTPVALAVHMMPLRSQLAWRVVNARAACVIDRALLVIEDAIPDPPRLRALLFQDEDALRVGKSREARRLRSHEAPGQLGAVADHRAGIGSAHPRPLPEPHVIALARDHRPAFLARLGGPAYPQNLNSSQAHQCRLLHRGTHGAQRTPAGTRIPPQLSACRALTAAFVRPLLRRRA